MQVSQSDIVRVRRRRWRVVDVRGYEQCQIVTVTPLGPFEPTGAPEANDRGVEHRFVTPFDLVERIDRRSRLTPVPRRLWRRACRALVAADTPPGALACVRLAKIDLLPHQLEPALAIVRGLGCRLLLADDVGLGKTIQAGLIVSELRALGAAERVLIITPAGLRDQWADELSERFNIEGAVLDAQTLRRSTAVLPVGLSPWQTAPVAIVSIDYLKRTEVLAAASACRWDVVVVDEAHGVAGDSDRHAAAAALAAQAPYVVLLTATPHSGDQRTFASLCALGAMSGERLLTFRRSRQSLALACARFIHRLHVRMSRDEVRMHALLARFSHAIRQQHDGANSRSDYWLALSVLHKRALSSARSLRHTVDRRLAALASTGGDDTSQLRLPLDDPAGELTPADEAPGWPPLLSLDDAAHERDLLGALADAAARAERHETKIAALARLLRRIGEPAIVFTEYRDTLLHVQACLAIPSVTLHGGMARDERLEAMARFTGGSSRLLLATDAAGEGLNLQRTCRLVINLELPWNPVRLEQRIGRVDRLGQTRSVHVFHLIARESGETRVLSRLQSRVARARAEIGGVNPLGSVDSKGTDESVIARLVIAGETEEMPRVDRPETSETAGTLWTPSLDCDARAEAERLASARIFTRSGDDQVLARLQGVGPSVSRARRSRTRAALSGSTLALWQVVAADASDRPVGSTIVAVMLAGRLDDAELLARVTRAADAWRERVTIAHKAFASARLSREQAVAAGLLVHAARSSTAFQPGLFERRGEREHSFVAAAQETVDRDCARRLAAIERSAAISFLPPQLLLVLTP
jgi:superfamily II DNA or RNA helicase